MIIPATPPMSRGTSTNLHRKADESSAVLKMTGQGENRVDCPQTRQKHLSRSYAWFMWFLRGFGAVPQKDHRRRSFGFRCFYIARLFVVLTLILLFNAQLTFLFVQATAKLQTTTVVKLHFFSRSQFLMNIALGIVIFSRRSRKLPAVLSAIVKACVWAYDEDWRIFRWFIRYCWFQLLFLFGALFPVGVALKFLTGRHLRENLLGTSLPAEVTSVAMITIQTLGIAFRIAHLSLVVITCGALGLQFRRLNADLKVSRSGKTTADRTMSGLLVRHYQLSELVGQFDAIFSPSLLLFTAADLVVVTCLISSLISSGQMEAAMGLYITQTSTDIIVYTTYTFGAILVLISRVVVAAYLNHQAIACVPELYKALQGPDTDKELKGSIKVTLQRLRDLPVALSCWGLIIMNKNFILTITGLLASYLVVVIEISSKNGACISPVGELRSMMSATTANATILTLE
ncbi:hypothetical protein BV898_12851 [Hypsibius exemplaris]|uniref:Gustatory receptor n=1 Tax=Hypsibius exemplaris TaxID=2072580 RepID=A0A1W0WCL8_HYPEX|nr:hypothetical protein BV898_12851 [Hypsibius exemplaris]